MTEHPTLIDCDGDRWEWGTDSTGKVGYRTSRTGDFAWTREAVERLWGPVKEVSESREPRVFQMPECPDDVLRVASVVGGTVFTRTDRYSHYWHRSDGETYSWSDLLNLFTRGLREVVETEYEAAVRRLREAGFQERGDLPTASPSEAEDMRTVLLHVLRERSDRD